MVAKSDTRSLAQECARLAEEKKGRDISIRNVRKLADIADYFVLVTGSNRKQTQTIADELSKTMKAKGRECRMEGYALGWWIVLDIGSVMIHILQEEARQYYGLDYLWADAPKVAMTSAKTTRKKAKTSS